METKEIIEKDLYRYLESLSSKSKMKAWFIPGFRFTFFFRKVSGERNFLLNIIYRFLHREYSILYGIQIPRTTCIGHGLYIGHFGNIVINGNAVIGNNCNIAQGVTIGQTNRGERKGVPVIGDKVWIGPNAVIVGRVLIGNNVLIAPNTYINFDVPDNSIVTGNPGKILYNQNATFGYINNIIE